MFRWRLPRRRGAATVEFAVTLPVLILIVLGAIETCSMIFLRQTLTIAAYEATRVALVPKVSNAQVLHAANSILNDRRVRGANIAITPRDFATAEVQSFITVTVSAPANSNALLTPLFFRGRTLVGQCSMMKEY
jgi:Flp pilus assembly protein TadG